MSNPDYWQERAEKRIHRAHRNSDQTIKEVTAAYQQAVDDINSDIEKIFNNLVRERESWYDHTLEGWDDMPAHAKSSLVGASLSIPITDGRLNLGTWQGIYLCEFRNHGGGRRIVATILGE